VSIIERIWRSPTARGECFQEAYIAHGGHVYPVELGARDVPLARIVGSAARCLDAAHRPSRREIAALKRRLQQGQPVLPARVAQLGEAFYIMDGHAAVAAARAAGRETVAAEVVQYVPPEESMAGLLQRERAEFIQQTGLRDIHLTLAGRYPLLLARIRDHHRWLEQSRGHLFLFAEAVADWWQRDYLPIITGLRESGALDELPALTEGDIYSYLSEYVAREAHALDIPTSRAMADLIALPGRDWRARLRAVMPPCLWEGRCTRS